MSSNHSFDIDGEDCTCVNCLALEILARSGEPEYEREVRNLILTGRNKAPFPDWDMVSGFFEAIRQIRIQSIRSKSEAIFWSNPVFRGPNLYSIYRLFTNNLNRHQWLSACPEYTQFWCFSCNLFGRGERGTNFDVGDIDLPDISSSAYQHGKNRQHLKLYRKLLSYEQPADFHHVDENEKLRIFIHDEIIRKRRATVCFVINAVVLLAERGVPFREKTSNSPDYEKKLMTSFRQDGEPASGPVTDGLFYHTVVFLMEHTENDDITNQLVLDMNDWLTLDTQSKLICSIADSIRKKIRAELHKTDYVSIVVTKPFSTVNVDLPQSCTIVRYVDEKGEIHETCLGLHYIEDGSLFDHVRQIVNSYSLADKLVAIACDGRALPSSQITTFQNSISQIYPKTLLVHSCSLSLDYVIYQSLGHEVPSTSSALNLYELMIGLFRGNQTRRAAVRQFIAETSRIEEPLNFDDKLMSTMNAYRNQFADYFINLPNESSLYETERENGMLHDVCKFIKEPVTVFCLKLLSKISAILEPLNSAILRGLDVFHTSEQLETCLVSLKQLKNKEFESMWSFLNAVKDQLDFEDEASFENSKSFYETCFHNVMDNIIRDISMRFNYLNSVGFVSLLDPKKFPLYCKNFPKESFTSLTKHYNFQPQLKDQLKTLYSTTKLHNKTIDELVERYNDLPEVTKLICLLKTLLLSPPKSNKYERFENYVWLSKDIDIKESLADLSLIHLEKKSYIGELDSKSIESRNILDEIIDSFADKMDKSEFYRYINRD